MCAVRKLNHTLRSITNIVGKLEDKISTRGESRKWMGFGNRSGNNVSGILLKNLYMGRVSWKNIECMDL
jgi:hypothetical protein